jgi:hypothetical protein
MQIEIVFHGLDHSTAVEKWIHSKLNGIKNFASKVQRCRVVIDQPHRNHQHGNLYQIRMDLSVPNKELVINQQPGGDMLTHKDVYSALRDTFEAAERTLKDHFQANTGKALAHRERRRTPSFGEVEPELDTLERKKGNG